MRLRRPGALVALALGLAAAPQAQAAHAGWNLYPPCQPPQNSQPVTSGSQVVSNYAGPFLMSGPVAQSEAGGGPFQGNPLPVIGNPNELGIWPQGSPAPDVPYSNDVVYSAAVTFYLGATGFFQVPAPPPHPPTVYMGAMSVSISAFAGHFTVANGCQNADGSVTDGGTFVMISNPTGPFPPAGVTIPGTVTSAVPPYAAGVVPIVLGS